MPLLRVAAVVCLVLPDALGFEWGIFGGVASTKHSTEDLHGNGFREFLKANQVSAVLFYAPWCFYSQQMMPQWDIAAQKLKLHDPPIPLVKVNAHQHAEIGDEYGINAFPTMKLFVDGAVFNYDGQGRGWQQIVQWVNRHIDRDHILKNVEDVDHYLHDNDLSVVGMFPDGFNSTAFPKAARHFNDVMFAEARGTEISKQVASHLKTHAQLQCETIDVGPSKGAEKNVPLPREHMSCSATPRNPQHPNWRDKFSARVEGKELKVKRDDAVGWDQLLKLNCCDTIVKDSKENKRYDFTAPSIVMFMPHDERFDRYTGDLDDFHALEKWVSSRRTPMVMELNEDTASKILDSGNADKMPILFLVNGKADHKEVMKKAAPTLRGRVLVCFSGAMSPVEKRLSEMVGIEDDQAVVVLIQVHDGQFGQPQKKIEKYRLDWDGKTLEARSVEKFVKSFEGNTLKPWLRSEPVPGPEDSHGPVQVLVGSTFEDGAVNTKDVDVLVNFYAPWCGHCRKFEPEYRALAKKLKHVKTLSIAKIDATRNEVPQVQVMAFPTVLLFPAGVDKISRKVSYHGHRTPADITKWLHQHCTHKFSETAPVDYTPPPTSSGLLDDEEEDL